ncbi:hypothetical protein BN873_150182 [Candidatus Competibacter denitrificans Run_A_D11]|uniref:Uncharacterized protein n=1 Tax=Candidatus Competibacter denitrificans Run_A_D11 TaxID=1400863 RepID=W6M495_9GAMM|nr:hypothetical protein BN873_150182 [Candidatus Competibacter denitrificans Run_A_D11]
MQRANLQRTARRHSSMTAVFDVSCEIANDLFQCTNYNDCRFFAISFNTTHYGELHESYFNKRDPCGLPDIFYPHCTRPGSR